jgi:Tfp pilus assembly protein PilO
MKPFWRRRLLVPALLLLAVNAGAYLAYTRPRAKFEQDIAAQAVRLRQEVAAERTRVEAVRRRARSIEENNADVARFYKALGHKDSVLAVQEDLVGIARQLGLRVGSRAYAKETVKGSKSLSRFRITVPIEGSYGQIVRFLQRVEALPRFVTVDSISLREDTGAAGRSTDLSVVLSIYFLDEEGRDAEAT